MVEWNEDGPIPPPAVPESLVPVKKADRKKVSKRNGSLVEV